MKNPKAADVIATDRSFFNSIYRASPWKLDENKEKLQTSPTRDNAPLMPPKIVDQIAYQI